MTKTDLVLGNIDAILTIIRNFPMSIFDGDGKSYSSCFEFLMDVLRACGIDDRIILNFLVEKIYGLEGQCGFTINGLYEALRTGKVQSNPNNDFTNFLEGAIKVLLMAVFTSIFTCSAIPILPNKVFDYDSLSLNGIPLMDSDVARVVKEDIYNDSEYKLKIPIEMIDMMGMLNISPVSPNGNLYYVNGGKDNFYKKEKETTNIEVYVERTIHAGESYKYYVEKYSNISLNFFHVTDIGFTFSLSNPVDVDIKIDFTVKTYNGDGGNFTFLIEAGQTEDELHCLLLTPSVGIHSSVIESITINGFKGGGEAGSNNWVYLYEDSQGFRYWKDNGGLIKPTVEFGGDGNHETKEIDATATQDMTVSVKEDSAVTAYKYVGVQQNQVSEKYTRYKEIPDSVNEDSPSFISVYEGANPNLLYRSYDMNAFIWYVLNRGGRANQSEKNHLMWDNRVKARKEGEERVSSNEWNSWYDTKQSEGGEFYFNSSGNSGIYPIIQIEKFASESELLVRIPSQTYFAPKKREKLIIGEEIPRFRKFFNSSIYKFDWDYLQSITILNPKLLLARFIEHLTGLCLDTANAALHSISKKQIEYKLRKAVKNIIEADDMQVENCFKVFSNEDFDELLNDLLLERYTASKYGGESSRLRKHDLTDYKSLLDSVNPSATQEGNITQVKRVVNEVMVDPATEISTEFEFNFKLDHSMLEKLLFAITMPIIECLFTPQVMLLVGINFELLGVTNFKEALGNNFGILCNTILNKILELVKEIVKYIKDYILKLILKLFYTQFAPQLTLATLLIMLEQITDYLYILEEAVKCIPLMKFSGRKIGYVEDVDYADITAEQNIPESQQNC